MRSLLHATLIPLVSLACHGGAPGLHGGDRKYSEKAQTPIQQVLEASRKLVVEYLDGSIEVTGTTGGHVVVRGTRTDQATSTEKLAEAARDVTLVTEAKDGTARVVVEGPWRSSHPQHRKDWSKDYRVVTDLKIQVPADAEVVLTAVNGSTMVVRQVRGALRITNVNGGIQVDGAAGAAKLTTVNGSIEARFNQTPSSACTFTTVNGNVKLTAPAGLNADLKLNAVRGEMVTNFPFETTGGKTPDPASGIHVPGVARKIRIGQGGTAITCATVNGDLVIEKQ